MKKESIGSNPCSCVFCSTCRHAEVTEQQIRKRMEVQQQKAVAAQMQTLPLKLEQKAFSESKILGELYALALEDAGYTVDREFEVSDNLIHQAVCDGQIDMYPEYTGTALLTILDQPMETDPQVTYDIVKRNVCRKL